MFIYILFTCSVSYQLSSYINYQQKVYQLSSLEYLRFYGGLPSQQSRVMLGVLFFVLKSLLYPSDLTFRMYVKLIKVFYAHFHGFFFI